MGQRASGRTHPRIESLLAVLDRGMPGAAAGARRVLPALLEPLQRSVWPEVAWRWSRLTIDGFPVEAALGAADAVRFVIEVGGAEVDAHERLGIARRLVESVSGVAIGPEVLAFSERVQRGDAAMRWGARVDAECGERGAAARLLVELPGGAECPWLAATPWPGSTSPSGPLAGRVRRESRMILYDPVAMTTEVYFCVRRPSVELWRRALEELGLDAAGSLAALGSMSGADDPDEPIVSAGGITVRFDGRGQAEHATLYVPATRLWSSDAAAAEASARMRRAVGGGETATRIEAELFESSLAGRTRMTSSLGVAVGRAGAAEVLLRLSPPTRSADG